MKTKTENETITATWEENAALAALQRHGAGRKPAVKVKTKEICRITDGELWFKIKTKLREGCEVRLADAGGNEFVRFYPLVNIDTDRLYPCAQTMGVFRQTAYEGIVPRYSKRGRQLSEDEVETAKEIVDLPSVTPDKVVRCPKCGAMIRVGKPKTESSKGVKKWAK